MNSPCLFGILNVTSDSFFDGGLYLNTQAAVDHAQELFNNGADVIDVGLASSNPDACEVSAQEEIERLSPVLDALSARIASISVDTYRPETQLYALRRGVGYLNDIAGFPQPTIYPELASASCKLVVMHSVHAPGLAQRSEPIPATHIWEAIFRFFDERTTLLERASISRERMILDPGMGYFLGADPKASDLVASTADMLRERFGLPTLISVSRKSFLRSMVGRSSTQAAAGTLAAEMFLADLGVNYIRTHDTTALRDAILVTRQLRDRRRHMLQEQGEL